MKFILRLLFLFLIMASAPAADQQAVIVRLAPVYAEASSASHRISQINAGAQVSVFERKGGWKQIFSEEKSIIGWVRSYQVRENMTVEVSESKPEPDSRGFLSGLATLSRKASGLFRSSNSSTSSGTATIGVRGLSEAELKAAKPDLEELKKMQGFASDDSRLTEFSRDGKLKILKVKHIKVKKSKKKKKSDK